MTHQTKKHTMTRTINIDGQPVEYELEYKKVKNMNLRIRKDGSIYVSVNRYVTRQQADAFVLKNAEFIKKARERIQKRRQLEGCEPVGKDRTYKDGEMINLYGEPYKIRLFTGNKEGAEVLGQVLIVTLKEKENAARQKRIVEKFLADECAAQMERLCRQVYPSFALYGIPYPEIRIRSMTSRWGSCQPQKGVLTFARQLLSAPTACQEYVVVHEFTHFLQADHSPKFHALMTDQMPDWKERKKLLNSRTWV